MTCATLTTMILMCMAAPLGAQVPTNLDLDAVRGFVVQHDGRYPPLDTAARDVVEEVSGTPFYRGHDPVAVLLAWTFDAQGWMREPLVRIGNAELRKALKLPPQKEVFSYAELISHDFLREQIDHLSHVEEGQKLNPLQSKVSGIHEKLIALQRIFDGQALRMIPDPSDNIAAWKPISSSSRSRATIPGDVQAAWNGLGAAFLKDDAAAFASAAEQLRSKLEALPAAARPAPGLLETELHYNAFRPFRKAWIVMVIGAVLAAIAMVVRKKWFDVAVVTVFIAGFAILTYGLSLRWQIAGRIPASNMFESLLFLSWGGGAFAILAMLVQRQRLVPLITSVMGSAALVLADVLPLNSYIRPIPPVLLDTVWMSIHVPVIMASYFVLAMAVLVAHIQIVQMAVAPGKRQLTETTDNMHYWFVHVGSIMLFIGIVTGSMWGASSWGRYWGWDPKEVWSLVACLGYLIILHVRIDHDRIPRWAYVAAGILMAGLFAAIVAKFSPLTGAQMLALCTVAAVAILFVAARDRFATAVKSVLAFWMIIMTYVGVNYVLGIGLHSYGFGTGAVASRMFLCGGIDLAFVALCSVVYLLRKRGTGDPSLQPQVAPSR